MPTTKKTLNFVAPDDLIADLDKFTSDRGFSSRAGAIKFLLTWALKAYPAASASAASAPDLPPTDSLR